MGNVSLHVNNICGPAEPVNSFMGQLGLSRFRGDTTSVFVARIISTFFGGLIGMVVWYGVSISSLGEKAKSSLGISQQAKTIAAVRMVSRQYLPFVSPYFSIQCCIGLYHL